MEYYHYFCCLFSSEGVQRGKDEEGLNGFLAEDLKKEIRRGETLFCDFCKKNGATIPCHRLHHPILFLQYNCMYFGYRKTCKKNYHFSCGALCSQPGEHLFIFRNNMDSFCFNHGPKQNKIPNISPDPICMVCLDTCGRVSGPGPGKLVSPCCGRTFHRDCVQKTSLQAGKAALKCPACNDKEKFNEEMERCGVYIPHADAQWEMPENSNFYQFDDMLNMYRRCDSILCSSPHGREFSRPGTMYEVIKCETCGQSGVHVKCGKLELKNPKYTCDTCQPRDNDETEDSDEEDRIVREKLDEHERRKEALFMEKNRLLYLVHEEKKRLRKCKEEEERRINEIKSILSDPDPDPSPSSSSQSPTPREGKMITKKVPPQVFIVSNNVEQRPQERFAIHMPRRAPSSISVPDPDNCDIPETQDDDDESGLKIPRIENVCGGSEAAKMNDISRSLEGSIQDISDDSDIEIVDTSSCKKVDIINLKSN